MTQPLYAEWDRTQFLVEDTPFIPKIFDASLGETIPDSFNVVSIKLDAGLHSSLQWKEEKAYAQQLIEKGYLLFWQIDLGLFRGLSQPLADEMQFRSFGIAIDHFVNEIWDAFQTETFGVSLYRGSLDFYSLFPWDEEQKANLQIWLKDRGSAERPFEELVKEKEGKLLLQLFCRDAIVEYLDLLTTRLPPSLAAFALLEAYSIRSSVLEALLLSRESFQHIHPILRGGSQAHRLLRWEGASYESGFIGRWSAKQQESAPVHIGVCLPAQEKLSEQMLRRLEELVTELEAEQQAYCFVAEELITEEWEGLDRLYYLEEGMSVAGLRRLQGFVAAGGTLVTLEKNAP